MFEVVNKLRSRCKVNKGCFEVDTWKHREALPVFGHAHVHRIQIRATLMSQGLLLLSKVTFLSSLIYIIER